MPGAFKALIEQQQQLGSSLGYNKSHFVSPLVYPRPLLSRFIHPQVCTHVRKQSISQLDHCQQGTEMSMEVKIKSSKHT